MSAMVDHSEMRLGKQPPRHDPRTLQLASYLETDVLPPPPAHDSWTRKVREWPMMRNDTVGDCTCAAAGHMIQEWTAYASSQLIPSDDEIIKAYSAITGYDPITGQNDNGAVELDVLNYWRKTGIAGRNIYAFAAIEPGNHDHVKDAVELFGNCYIGVGLPISAQRQRVWSVPPGGPVGDGAPWSWGGHAVPVVGYNSRTLTVVTWGALKRMTWKFWDTYCDEAYAVLSEDWLREDRTNPRGIDMDALGADLKAVTSGH